MVLISFAHDKYKAQHHSHKFSNNYRYPNTVNPINRKDTATTIIIKFCSIIMSLRKSFSATALLIIISNFSEAELQP